MIFRVLAATAAVRPQSLHTASHAGQSPDDSDNEKLYSPMARSRNLVISQDIGLPDHMRAAIVAAHKAACAKGLYDLHCYMASNPQEYWAEGILTLPPSPELCHLSWFHPHGDGAYACLLACCCSCLLALNIPSGNPFA